jgi:hypothetical protein
MFGYVGLGPGQELIPYFLALVGFVFAAVLAVVQWPVLVLLRRFRGAPPPPPPAGAGAPEALAAPGPAREAGPS